MSRKSSLIRYSALAVVALATLAWAVSAVPAHAQCGEPPKSSCATCHEKRDPVATKGEWHQIHATKDICINCHGGNATAADEAGAHQTMVAQPLADIYTDCHSCHPEDYTSRAERFAAEIGVTPASCPTPTPAPAAASGGSPIIMSPPTAAATPTALDVWVVTPLAFVLAMAVAVISFTVGRRGHARP